MSVRGRGPGAGAPAAPDDPDSSADPGAGPGAGPGAVASEAVYLGRVVRLYRDQVRFPDGSMGTLEMIRHPGASAVLPFLDDPWDPDPRVGLIRQYRYAAGGSLLEVPAGLPHAGEDWEACARRELTEETGWVAGQVARIGEVLTTPGFTDERIRLFVAWELDSAAVEPDPDEFIERVTVPMSEALRAVWDGDLVDAKSIATLLLANERRHRLAGLPEAASQPATPPD